MRVICCYSTARTETGFMRGLVDGERRVIIYCPWGQLPIHTYMAVRGELTDDEIRAVQEAFGWSTEPSAHT